MDSATPQRLPEALEGRRFAFYPAIRGIEHNEWTYQESTWSEVRVRNVASGQEFWIPRNYLGSVSSADSPVLILGLHRELQCKAGSVFPYREVVTEMPATRAAREDLPETCAAPPPRRRALSGTDAKTLKLLGLAVGAGLIAAIVGFLAVVGGFHNPLDSWFEPETATADQRYLGLSADHTYFEVVGRLAAPESEDWISGEEDELQFQALRYPSRGYIVILMGGSRSEMRYLGTVHDPTRRVLDSARMARGGDTSSMMRHLPQF